MPVSSEKQSWRRPTRITESKLCTGHPQKPEMCLRALSKCCPTFLFRNNTPTVKKRQGTKHIRHMHSLMISHQDCLLILSWLLPASLPAKLLHLHLQSLFLPHVWYVVKQGVLDSSISETFLYVILLMPRWFPHAAPVQAKCSQISGLGRNKYYSICLTVLLNSGQYVLMHK